MPLKSVDILMSQISLASFVLSFFPLDVLDEIWDLIESVSEGFLAYSFILFHNAFKLLPYEAL